MASNGAKDRLKPELPGGREHVSEIRAYWAAEGVVAAREMDRQECLSYYGFGGERGVRILDRFLAHEMFAVIAVSKTLPDLWGLFC